MNKHIDLESMFLIGAPYPQRTAEPIFDRQLCNTDALSRNNPVLIDGEYRYPILDWERDPKSDGFYLVLKGFHEHIYPILRNVKAFSLYITFERRPWDPPGHRYRQVSNTLLYRHQQRLPQLTNGKRNLYTYYALSPDLNMLNTVKCIVNKDLSTFQKVAKGRIHSSVHVSLKPTGDWIFNEVVKIEPSWSVQETIEHSREEIRRLQLLNISTANINTVMYQ